jgi:hypothetical protein
LAPWAALWPGENRRRTQKKAANAANTMPNPSKPCSKALEVDTGVGSTAA